MSLNIKNSLKKILKENANNLLREIQCDKCPNKKQIYSTSSNTCINRSSKHAMKFITEMTFCDKYFSEKLNQDDNTVLNKLLNIKLYQNSEGKIIKLRDYIPKEIIIPKTKKSATLVLIVIVVLIIGFLPQRTREKLIKGMKFILETNVTNPQFNFILHGIIMIVKNLTIMSFMYSFAGFTSHFFHKLMELITGKTTITPNKNHVSNEIVDTDRQNEINGVVIMSDTILEILQHYKMVKANNIIILSKLGLNTIKEIAKTNVPKAKIYYKGNSKIYFALYDMEFVIFEQTSKGKAVFISYTNYELKNKKITPLLDELDKLKNKFQKEHDKIQQKIQNISEKVKSIEKKLSLENKKGSKKNDLTIKQYNEQLDTENEMTDEKVYLFKVRDNYNKFLKSKGLLYKAQKRIENINITNWRSDTIFMEEWIKQQNSHLSKDYYANISPEDLDTLFIHKKELIPKIEVKSEEKFNQEIFYEPKIQRHSFNMNTVQNNININNQGTIGDINAPSVNMLKSENKQKEQQEKLAQRRIIDGNRQKVIDGSSPVTYSGFKQTENYNKLKKAFKEQTKKDSNEFEKALLTQDPTRLNELIFENNTFMLPNKK